MRARLVIGLALCALVGCAKGSGEDGGAEDAETSVAVAVAPSASVTAGGGARAGADGERALLYVAPVQPVGELTSPSYRLRLGPAASRSAR
jgi:hypothetical protein